VWNEALPVYAVIGCNPSTADETRDDPTIRKVRGFGERLGFGGVLMLNVGAFRATDPKDWKSASDPFGPSNTIGDLQNYLATFAIGTVVAAWGKPCVNSRRGSDRAEAIKNRLPRLMCWGRNTDGSPRHPLMLAYSTQLEPYN
jgi:hypothetical protein